MEAITYTLVDDVDVANKTSVSSLGSLDLEYSVVCVLFSSVLFI